MKLGRLFFEPKCRFVELRGAPTCSKFTDFNCSMRSVCTTVQRNIKGTLNYPQPLVSSNRDNDSTNSASHGNFSRRKTLLKTGVVFDIDGVLLRGRNVIPSAKEAIAKLERANIPLIYLTNGGCETEESKASVLEKRLGVQVCTYS